MDELDEATLAELEREQLMTRFEPENVKVENKEADDADRS
jgi:hypothetical protein